MFMLPALGSGPCFGRSRLTARLKTQAGCKYLRTIRSCTRQTAARRQPLSRVLVHAAQQQEDLQSDAEDKVPPGCARYTVQLSKPLGMVLEEKSNGSILVAEVIPGGNADRCGEVSVGDQLIATSGLTYTTQQKYQDNWVPGGEQLVRLNVRGEDFKTVMAAISSHPAHLRVQLEFQRCS